MNERIRFLRDELNLSRAAFGERIGVSGDVVNNLERGRVEIKDHIVKLICKEFSINEDWLRTGNGTIFIQSDTFSLDKFVKEHGMTGLELEIIKTYFDLPEDIRSMVIDRFQQRLSTNDDIKESSKQTQEEYPDIAKEVADYQQELLAEKKGTTFPASDTKNA